MGSLTAAGKLGSAEDEVENCEKKVGEAKLDAAAVMLENDGSPGATTSGMAARERGRVAVDGMRNNGCVRATAAGYRDSCEANALYMKNLEDIAHEGIDANRELRAELEEAWERAQQVEMSVTGRGSPSGERFSKRRLRPPATHRGDEAGGLA